jgi:hypothetical protein
MVSSSVAMNECRKYGEWMTDAALGALAPKKEHELLAHTGECEACLEAYQHAREVAAFVDRGVQSFVSDEPSPQFAVGLRARIAQERSRARFVWLSWKPVATTVAVLAMLTVLVVRHERRPHSQPLALNVASHASSSMSSPSAVVSPAKEAPLRSGRRERSQDQSRLLASASVRRERPIRTRATSQPEVLVPPGQLDAIIRLAKATQSGQINGKALLALQDKASAPLEIRPLEIPSGQIDGKALLALQDKASAPLQIGPLEIPPIEPTEPGAPVSNQSSGRH